MTEEDRISEIFKAHFSKRKANEMMKLWVMVQHLGETKARKFMSDDTWYVYKKDLAAVGVQNTPTMAAMINNFSFQIPHPVFTINHDDSDLEGFYKVHGILPFTDSDRDPGPDFDDDPIWGDSEAS